MDERCPTTTHIHFNEHGLRKRCRDCSHVHAVHGYDGICDICALERRLLDRRLSI